MAQSVSANIFHSGEKVVIRLKNCQKCSDDNLSNLNIGICLDVSGSMGTSVYSKDQSWSSTKMMLCKEAIKFILTKLGDNRIGVVTFDSHVKRLLPLQKVTDRTNTVNIIDRIFPGSYTNLSSGICESLRMMESTEDEVVKYLLVFTDGCANVGITDQDALLQMLKDGLKKNPGLKVAIMGYGADCNATLLQYLAEQVDGSYHQLNSAEDIPKAMGEEFGTALQTCQQDIRLKYDSAAITPVDKSSVETEEGVLNAGDLLLEEQRDYLFELTDPDLVSKITITGEYVDCRDGSRHHLTISGNQSVEDESCIHDAENIIHVAEATQTASNKFGAERQSIIKACLEKITLNKPFGTRTENLIRSLEQQLEVCEILPPSCLRSYSSSARRQRGGDFASKGVALMRGLSQGVVEEACSQGSPFLNSNTPLSGPTLSPPRLVRQTTGSIFTPDHNQPNS